MAEEEHRVLLQGLKIGLQFLFEKEHGVGIGGVKGGVDDVDGEDGVDGENGVESEEGVQGEGGVNGDDVDYHHPHDPHHGEDGTVGDVPDGGGGGGGVGVGTSGDLHTRLVREQHGRNISILNW